MRIAIATPTGQTGRALVDILLTQGRNQFVLLARRPDRLIEAQQRGAIIMQGDLYDEDYVRRATKGADALFWAAPPPTGSDDVCRDVKALAENAATAIDDNGIARVVHLSSIGAHRSERLGPILALREAEIILDQTNAEITHLRAGFFMENFLWCVDGVNEDDAVYLPVSGSVRVPMIATADIAREAARLLSDDTWVGRRDVELVGPSDVSFDEAAMTIGEALGRDVRHVHVADRQAHDWMLSMAHSEHCARMMLELFAGIESGVYGLQRSRSEAIVTPTTFGEFVNHVLLPALHAQEPAVPT